MMNPAIIDAVEEILKVLENHGLNESQSTAYLSERLRERILPDAEEQYA